MRRPGLGRLTGALARAFGGSRRSGGPEPSRPTGLGSKEPTGADDGEDAVERAAALGASGATHLACGLLEGELARTPHHGPMLRALARWSQQLAERHGAVVVGDEAIPRWWTLEQLADAHDDITAVMDPLGVAHRAIERAVELEPDRLAWWGPLLDLREATGDLEGAIAAGDHLLAGADQSSSAWINRARHRWQFQTERLRDRVGRGRVHDPLFTAEVVPVEAVGAAPFGGVAHVRFTHQGLNVAGVVPSGTSDVVEVLVDGEVVRTANLGTGDAIRAFALLLRRATLPHLPPTSRVEVRTTDGAPLWVDGRYVSVEARVPGGAGTLADLRADGIGIDKKGMIGRRPDELRALQDAYLQLYALARDAFERLGHPLFAFYGTLLGIHRDGDLIPGDDDFDVAYVSEADTPEGVRAEAVRLIEALVGAGFTVSVNRRGRLFRLHREGHGDASLHLDVHPMWFVDGYLYVPNHVRLRATADDFLPLRPVTLRDTAVLLPADPEVFLAGHYGSGWRSPDPGYVDDPTGAAAEVVALLDRALLPPDEQRELADRLATRRADDPSLGRFVPIGSQSLYPLDELIE